jgi:hypothetical protein
MMALIANENDGKPMLIKFPATKHKTPQEFQSEYDARFWRETRRVLPWVLIIPALLLLGSFAFVPDVIDHLKSVATLLRLGVVYSVLVVGLWIAFGPSRPNAGEGERTRAVIDASRKE